MDPTLFRLITEEFSLSTSSLAQGVSFSTAAHFNEQTILNRSSPVITYDSSGPIEFSVVLDIVALDKDEWNAGHINDLVASLISLKFPKRSGILPPGICYITIGSGLIFDNYPTVCTNISGVLGGITYDEKGNAKSANVTLNFKGIELEAQSREDFAGDAHGQFDYTVFK